MDISHRGYIAMLIPSALIFILVSIAFFYSTEQLPPCAENIILFIETNLQDKYLPCILFDPNVVSARIVIIVSIVLIIIVVVIVITLNVLVYKHLSQKAAMSLNETLIQRQLSIIFVTQPCVIAFCAFITGVGTILNAVLIANVKWSSMFSCMLSVTPVVNPIFTMLTIKSYRNAIVKTINTFAVC
uniref:G_PROTEIN_RECEP_F1_2 domain-containing protein n=1 Tax=Panagrellus redivivus TaxID=6233 RepID=A0A7E4VRF9_PANRE